MDEATGPVVLIVRDGWGHNPNPEHDAFNAVKLADTPRGDALLTKYPCTLIKTSARDVGLPDSTMGNSEVGHQNLGAGRIVNQESVRITVAIEDGTFYENPALANAVAEAQNAGGTVHLMGIASDAGVHGLMDHLYACVELCKRRGVERVALHLFTDGRDTGPFSGQRFITQIEAKLAEIGVGRIASLCGRYYAMDRDNRWERVRQAYEMLTGRSEAPSFPSADAAIQDYYDQPTNDSQQGDEFVTPRTIGDPGPIRDGDSVIFYNYRGDRPREITRAFRMDSFYGEVAKSPDSGEPGFDRGDKIDLVSYVTMSQYDASFGDMVEVAFIKPPKMANIGGDVLSRLGKTQFRSAETEKFPHVTFFFNDYREEPFEGESREMAQSPKVATYDLQPEMSAEQVCQYVLDRLSTDDCEDFILVNFANGDMVGHTGKLEAAIRACETVDGCVGRIVDATLKRKGKLIVTADHGNAEQMFDPDTGKPHTAHTLYDVECILVGEDLDARTGLREGGRLADVFPTVLELMGLDPVEEMTGKSLLQT